MGRKKTTRRIKNVKSKKGKKTVKLEPNNSLLNKVCKFSKKSELPVKLCEAYCNLVGSKYPDTYQDINDVIEILLIQYNRILKSDIIDCVIVNNIKSCCKTLTRIFIHYTDDIELKKIYKVIELIDLSEDGSPVYLKKELDAIYSQVRSNESKYYLRILDRIKNKNLQTKYLNALKKVKIETELTELENNNLFCDEVDDILKRLDNFNFTN